MDFSKYGLKHAASCETCQFYVSDDQTDTDFCSLSLDEDEMSDFIGGNTKGCPYYRFYDEYMSVRKQI